MHNINELGQVFTQPPVVQAMLALRRNSWGRVLEPACGNGAFSSHLPGCTAIELDPAHAPEGSLQMDFFTLPTSERFATIIGNPPYVRYQDVTPKTKALLNTNDLNQRANLYLFFIEKCLRHLEPGGELIFITPRDFMKTTGSVRLNQRLAAEGSITDAIELGDAKIFEGALPNCLIWRYEKDRVESGMRYAEIGARDRLAEALAHPRWQSRRFEESHGHLVFAETTHALKLLDVAGVKVGAVSGADAIFSDPALANREFVCAHTVKTGRTRKMLWLDGNDKPPSPLLAHKKRLLARRVIRFDESNWWCWGRSYPNNDGPRVYVNGKTRVKRPFFVHPCQHYDGAVLAIFPHNRKVQPEVLRDALNLVDWNRSGYVCDGRFLFSQRSLENAPIPAQFEQFLP